jgi:hypothetical protein
LHDSHNIELVLNSQFAELFGVSYAWLKTGEGKIFDTSFDDTTALFDRIMASDNETAVRNGAKISINNG